MKKINTLISICLVSILVSGCMGMSPAAKRAAKKRENTAKNIHASQSTLLKLSNDDAWFVRCAVAENPNTSSEVLSKLSNDTNAWVRGDVAKNPNTSSEVLSRLSNDDNWQVRYSVLQNPNASAKILLKTYNDYLKLSEGEKKEVIAINRLPVNIAYHPNAPADLLLKIYETSLDKSEVAFALGKNQNTPVKILEKIANSGSGHARSAVASNPSTPVNILKELAEDGQTNVRVNITKNINTPIETLKILLQDEHYYVRANASQNPKIQQAAKKEKFKKEQIAKKEKLKKEQIAKKEELRLQAKRNKELANAFEVFGFKMGMTKNEVEEVISNGSGKSSNRFTTHFYYDECSLKDRNNDLLLAFKDTKQWGNLYIDGLIEGITLKFDLNDKLYKIVGQSKTSWSSSKEWKSFPKEHKKILQRFKQKQHVNTVSYFSGEGHASRSNNGRYFRTSYFSIYHEELEKKCAANKKVETTDKIAKDKKALDSI